MDNLPLIDAVITSYQDIPSLQYPTLSSAVPTNLVLTMADSQPVVNGILPDNSSFSIGWTFPLSDNSYLKYAVGWQLQICEGFFTSVQSQSMEPPGTVAFEYIFNLKDVYPLPSPPYVDLFVPQTGSIAVPSSVLQPGTKYTARIRVLVFSELGAGTVDGQYFKYTEFGTMNFTVNDMPSAVNLRVNGQINPPALSPRNGLNLSFTFVDSDGPQYLYRVQIGTVPGPTFSDWIVWDSGLISAGPGYGNRDLTVAYSGPPLSPLLAYAWRVDVQDGLTDGGWTGAYDTFGINNLPTTKSLEINGQDILSNTITVPASGSVMTWTFFDLDGDPQCAYNLVVAQNGDEILNTGDVYSSASSTALPEMSAVGTVRATLRLMDTHEFGDPITAQFDVSIPPQVFNVLIDGRVNPGDVASLAPMISWMFLGNNAGSTQASYRIQVATDDTFGFGPGSIVLWDSGAIESSDTSVVYGSTPDPVVGPYALSHGTFLSASGYYYVRVSVSDQISPSSPAEAFFAINNIPLSPLLIAPMTGSYSGSLDVIVTPPTLTLDDETFYVFDSDNDPVTYTLEITSRRSSDSRWEYLAGPFDTTALVYPAAFTYSVDLGTIPSGNDYGIRVVANDGFADSAPDPNSVTPLNSAGLGFTILNHPPTTPTLLLPKAGETYSSLLAIRWLEAAVPDIDGDNVFYLVEYTTDSSVPNPVYASMGYFPAGTIKAFLDVTTLPNGTNYQVRITAIDDKGGIGDTNRSGVFSIDNSPSVTDFERLEGNVYIGTSDGRILAGKSSAWQADEDFEDVSALNAFVSGQPSVQAQDGSLSISTPSGTSYIVRI